MQVAFLVYVSVPDGTSITEVRKDIERTVVVDIDNESNGGGCLEALAVDTFSARAYDPELGRVVVYQP